MAAKREIRASDQDREQLVAVLRAHYAEGRLSMAEFQERMDAAYTSKTWGELLDLTSDLPAEVQFGADPAPPPLAERAAVSPPVRPAGSLLRWLWPVAPILLTLFVVASIAWASLGSSGAHHHYMPFIPWPLLIFSLFVLRRGIYRRRGQWPRGRR
jgi:uncharacterized protein DUF1707